MPQKRLPAIADRAVRPKETNGRAGKRWNSVVEKGGKDAYRREARETLCPS